MSNEIGQRGETARSASLPTQRHQEIETFLLRTQIQVNAGQNLQRADVAQLRSLTRFPGNPHLRARARHLLQQSDRDVSEPPRNQATGHSQGNPTQPQLPLPLPRRTRG